MRTDEFKAQIEFGLENLDKIHGNIKRFIAKESEEDFKLSALAYECMGYYNAIEHLIIRVLKFSKIEIPSGAYSHRDTLTVFQATIPTSNLDPTLFKILSDLMSFRHVATKIYGFLLSSEKLQRLLDQILERHDQIKQLFLFDDTATI